MSFDLGLSLLLTVMSLMLLASSVRLAWLNGALRKARNAVQEEKRRRLVAEIEKKQGQPALVDALLVVPNGSRLASLGTELSMHAGQVDVELPGSKARVVSVEVVGGSTLVVGLSALPVQYAQGAVDHPPASEWMGG